MTMTRVMAVTTACVLAACSATPSGNDAGVDAGPELPTTVKVSGNVVLFPDAVAVLADAGVSFTTQGLTVRTEEPFKVAINDPAGIFATATLDATGAFSTASVPVDLVTLGIAIGVRDDVSTGAPRVVRSATSVYDVALMDGAKPAADVIGVKGYAVPLQLHDALTALITPATIHGITGLTDAGTLIDSGFVLGRIVDANGVPVAGLTITPLGATAAARTARLFYPSADLKTLVSATSSNGLFVYVHTGSDVDTFQFTVAGHAEYKQRNAGAAKDACLVLPVFPGLVAP
jgi:hypothetical protein